MNNQTSSIGSQTSQQFQPHGAPPRTQPSTPPATPAAPVKVVVTPHIPETTPASDAPPPPVFTTAEIAALALSPAQRLAIENMLAGHTLGASATAAGVTRITLYRWLKDDPKFQAAYNAWQLDALTRARTRLVAITDTAVTTVATAAKTDARVALVILKSMGILDRPTPGSTDAEEIAQKMSEDEAFACVQNVLSGRMTHSEAIAARMKKDELREKGI